MTDELGYEALRRGVGAVEIGRDVVRASGPDAGTYLQGQLSQDIARLAPGEWAWSLVLQPQGKLDAFVRCLRVAPDEFYLDTDAGTGAALVDRLLRFRLRTKVDVERLEWRAVAVRGPEAKAPPAGGGGDAIAVPFEWNGWAGYDLLGPLPVSPEVATAVTAEAFAAARVEAGFPRHGAELDERTIPAEAGLVEASVSFTKGCYTGQELVARIDSRGSNVPRHLRGFVLSGPAQPGDRLLQLDREVGRLTSVALSPRLGWVGLGYVGRAVQVGGTVVVAGQVVAGQAPGTTGEVRLLPLGELTG